MLTTNQSNSEPGYAPAVFNLHSLLLRKINMINITKPILVGIVASSLIAGCASNKAPKPEPRTPIQTASDRLEKYSKALLEEQEQIRKRFQKTASKPATVAAIQPTFDPLEGIRVTLDVEDANVHHVLRALAAQIDMDLVIHPNLIKVPHRISVHFNNAEASKVFKEVLRIADVSGDIEGDMLIVNPMEERVMHLDFMESATTMSLSAGGDVLGANQDGSGSSGLTGNFQLQSSSAQNTNPYDALESMLDILVGSADNVLPSNVSAAGSVEEVTALATVDTARRNDTPLYSLNRITGTLYVRARPSVMNSIANLVQRYRVVMGRQILIEAQILEVTLSESFSYGVDWSFLHERTASTFGNGNVDVSGSTSATPNITQGDRSLTIPGRTLEALGDSFLGLNYLGENFGISVDLLKTFGDVVVLSNPSVRTKHGQPALISVGRSTTYVAETGSTIIPNGDGSTVTQNVETGSVFNGLVIGLLPFIADNGKISMIVHPIQSSVDAASLALQDVGGESRITLPQVDLKEISTTISLQNGDLIMLGGLIDRGKASNSDAVPGLSKIPLVGKLFEDKQGIDATRELVIVLKVTEV